MEVQKDKQISLISRNTAWVLNFYFVLAMPKELNVKQTTPRSLCSFRSVDATVVSDTMFSSDVFSDEEMSAYKCI